ncbi:hypothetical protein [Kitasatospora nipponensis]|uniref:hypothetical protein n=1 Tax=Kitasatospora nipponensis TaxID=258049 RepID=UPI0031E2B148
MLERGEPGDVLVQDIVLALVGGQGPQLLGGSLQSRQRVIHSTAAPGRPRRAARSDGDDDRRQLSKPGPGGSP